MTDNRIELEEPVVQRAQQNNRNKKSAFDRAQQNINEHKRNYEKI
jgi:hypothetical protein